MDIRKLQRAIVDGLEDVKAHDIVVFNTEALSPLFERVIIASGNSNRQTKALAGSVRETVKKRGLEVLRTEGEDNGEWIIVDCGAAVAHIMQPAIRDYYHLEEIWGAKPVRLKGGPVRSSALPKASEATRAPVPAPATAKKPPRPAARAGASAPKARSPGAARKSAKAPAKPVGRTVGKTAGRTGTQVVARKPTAGKPAPTRAAAAKKKPAAKRAAPAARPAARKAGSRTR